MEFISCFSLASHFHISHQPSFFAVDTSSNMRLTLTVLNIGHVRSRLGDSAALATLGRMGNIHVRGTEIAKVQCSFEIDRETNVVMFYDRSASQSSQVFDENAVPFEHGRLRRVVVEKGMNTIIGMDGVGRDLLAEREGSRLEENPHLARSVIGSDTVAPTGMETRIHALGPRQPRIRWKPRESLGVGRFGEVYDGLDLDHGTRMAVKVITQPINPGGPPPWALLKREVEILSSIKHKNIVDYIASQGWEEQKPEIFMSLKDGTLRSLVLGSGSIRAYDHAGRMCHDMLQALDYLAAQGIIHRDLKPEKILYKGQDRGYEFQLADFDLSSHQYQIAVAPNAGSPFYMAPESLFVTVVWMLDVGGLRRLEETSTNYEEIKDAVLSAANLPVCSRFRKMGTP
ncbi:kinase-like domain-containing protein [Parachaetomium inaequale]|uniref:mitogen-activated protein kinase n=1 Tax=Parachaetomium inaequale TaxID=2588326 RepID=A0AAN6P4H5_9PEZI|nr:kinase-like domain-containing protein [Parachaetomium inaequale]